MAKPMIILVGSLLMINSIVNPMARLMAKLM